MKTLWSVDGSGAGDELGSALAGQFDANGDGLGDVACGARGENAPGATDAGAVKILSGADGAVLRSVSGSQAAEHLGARVAVIGNVNNVPGREILAGAPGLDRVLVIDPTSAEVLIELYGQGSTNFGQSVADAGDMDSDGVVDFAVGQPGFDGPALTNNGRVTVYSASPWVTRYCNSGTSSSGCTPLMSWSGSPRASASSGFLLTASGLEGQKSGLFFYSLGGRQHVPWGPALDSCASRPPLSAGWRSPRRATRAPATASSCSTGSPTAARIRRHSVAR